MSLICLVSNCMASPVRYCFGGKTTHLEWLPCTVRTSLRLPRYCTVEFQEANKTINIKKRASSALKSSKNNNNKNTKKQQLEKNGKEKGRKGSFQVGRLGFKLTCPGIAICFVRGTQIALEEKALLTSSLFIFNSSGVSQLALRNPLIFDFFKGS